MPVEMSRVMPEDMSEDMPERVSEGMSREMSEQNVRSNIRRNVRRYVRQNVGSMPPEHKRLETDEPSLYQFCKNGLYYQAPGCLEAPRVLKTDVTTLP